MGKKKPKPKPKVEAKPEGLTPQQWAIRMERAGLR